MSAPLAYKLANRLAAVEQIERAALVIRKSQSAGVDAQVMIDGGGDVERVDGPVNNLLAAGAGAANHLAHLHPDAGHQHAERVAPAVTAGILFHSRSSAELAHRDDQRFFEQTAVDQVGD